MRWGLELSDSEKLQFTFSSPDKCDSARFFVARHLVVYPALRRALRIRQNVPAEVEGVRTVAGEDNSIGWMRTKQTLGKLTRCYGR